MNTYNSLSRRLGMDSSYKVALVYWRSTGVIDGTIVRVASRHAKASAEKYTICRLNSLQAFSSHGILPHWCRDDRH